MRLFWIFLAEFLFSLHFAATLYINSSFLAHFFSLKAVGLLYVLGALCSLFFFFNAPRLINWLGIRKFLVLFLTLTLGSTIGAAFTHSRTDATIFFLIYASVSLMVFYALDILVEELTVNRETGFVRGLYLTVMSVGTMAGPLLITLFSIDTTFSKFYLAAAVVLLPIFLLATFSLKSRYKKKVHPNHSLPLRAWWKKKSVRRVTLARTTLELFYAIMTIYTPIYLHSVVGFEWKEVGIIFTIMLLPFVLFEWPIGALADREIGEKEIMSTGFLIMLVSLIFMPYIGRNLAYWALALFISRLGACFVEITSESYFFKRASSEDTGLISIFRISRSAGLVLGASIGALALHIWPVSSIFVVLAVTSFVGYRSSRKLVNTK